MNLTYFKLEWRHMSFYFFVNNQYNSLYAHNYSLLFPPAYSLPLHTPTLAPNLLPLNHNIEIYGNQPPICSQAQIAAEKGSSQVQSVLEASEEKKERGAPLRKKREKNSEKETISAKKNSQSNLINHFFIYFTTKDCSGTQVARIVNSLQKKKENMEIMVSVFYNLMKMININRGKKYINKEILLKYFTKEGLVKNIPETIHKIEKMQILTVDELARLLRKSFYCFMRQASLISILTSKRISILSKGIHLQRRNKIIKDLQEKPSEQ